MHNLPTKLTAEATASAPRSSDVRSGQDDPLDELMRQIDSGIADVPIDLRRNKRYPFSGRIRFQLCDALGRMLGPVQDGEALEISLWGMRFAAPRRLEIGQFVGLSFQFEVKGAQRHVLMLGEVRHVKPRPPGRWNVGCAFRETLSSSEATGS